KRGIDGFQLSTDADKIFRPLVQFLAKGCRIGVPVAELDAYSRQLFPQSVAFETKRRDARTRFPERFLESFDAAMPQRQRDPHGVGIVGRQRRRVADEGGPFAQLVVLDVPAEGAFLLEEPVLPFAKHLALAVRLPANRIVAEDEAHRKDLAIRE